jgi:hypothetical protein
MWSLKLTILFLATSTDPQGHATITQSLTQEVFDSTNYSDEESCKVKARWWMSAAASATGAVKKAECLQAEQEKSSMPARGSAYPAGSKRGSSYPGKH